MNRSEQVRVGGATAGFLNTDWNPRDLPAGASTRNVVLRTQDGAATSGSLYSSGAADTVVCIMHPREFMACHYLIPDIVGAGYAAWTQAPRSVGNDMRLEHEFALYDVAAGMRFLREAGFKRVVLLGNSGGSGLYALYAQQSNLRAGAAHRTHAGRTANEARVARHAARGWRDIRRPASGTGRVAARLHRSFGHGRKRCAQRRRCARSVREVQRVRRAASSLPLRRSLRYTLSRGANRARGTARRHRAQSDRRAPRRPRTRQVRRRGSRCPLAPRGRAYAADDHLAHRCRSALLRPVARSVGSPLRVAVGRGPVRIELRLGRLCPMLFARSVAVDVVGCVIERAAVEDRARASRNPRSSSNTPAIRRASRAVVADIYASLGSSAKSHRRVRGDHHGRALAEGEEAGRYIAGRIVRDWLRETFPQ